MMLLQTRRVFKVYDIRNELCSVGHAYEVTYNYNSPGLNFSPSMA